MNLPSNPETIPLLSIILFAPLGAAIVTAFLRDTNIQRWWTLVFTALVALFSFQIYGKFDLNTAEFQFVEYIPWIPWLKVDYIVGVDGISLLLVLLTTLIMPLVVLCSWRYIEKNVKEFMILLLIMETAMLGVFLSLNFILFFIFWESMLIPMALIIGIWGGPRKIYAALKFFIYTIGGSVFLLVAIIALYGQTGTFYIPELMGKAYSETFQIWIFLAFAIAFAVKVPMFPFHTWLPAAHVEAPTGGSVILASVLLKMGTYGFIRFCLPITPLAVDYFSPLLIILSVISIVYGGFAALAQSDLKKLVAYSSVSHMGFATLGIFIVNQSGIEGSILIMISHGITSGALFIAVGMIYERIHTRDLDKTAGLGKYLPIFTAFFGLFTLSSMAFPGTNSFIGEFLVMVGGFAWAKLIGQSWAIILMVLIIPGAILAAAYNLRMLQRFAYGTHHNTDHIHHNNTNHTDHSEIHDLELREILTFIPLMIFVFWIGLNPQPFTRVIHTSVENLVKQATLLNR